METPLALCVEDRLPPKLSRKARKEAIAENPANGSPLEGAADRPILWKPKRAWRITFLDGHPSAQQKFTFYARQWCQYANIFFNFVSEPDTGIRIVFTKVESSSFVGMEALKGPQHLSMIKLALSHSSTEEVFSHALLHEFVDVLGVIDEHQKPGGGFQWNKKAVFEELTAPPYECNKTRVRYSTSTEYGSSGAHCYNATWELVAIHQSGSPDFSRSSHYNQGIPIATILRRLEKFGEKELLDSKKGQRAKTERFSFGFTTYSVWIPYKILYNGTF